MGRAPCCEKVGLKRGRWTAEEDEILTKYIEANGEGSWRSLPKNAGLLRCGKSCRLRWINYLRTDLKRGNITTEEEQTIVKLHNAFGNRWSLIAGHLPGRTDNEIKNYWNSHLSRKIYTVTRPSVKSPSAITGILDIAPAPKRRREVSADRKGRGVTVKGKTTPSHGEKEQAEGLSSEKRQEERTLGNELVLSPIMEHGDGDMGAYDWLDGEMMRLNNEILECGVVEPSGNICYEKVTSEDQKGSCSSSMNSTLERDQWPNWAWEDGVEGGLHEWELEEISSWLWGGQIAEGDDRCTET